MALNFDPGSPRPLHLIEHDVLEMASRAELMFRRSIDALVDLNAEAAEAVVAYDDKVDQLDLRIERECLEALHSGRESGTNLRTIGTVLKIITDIERVADLSVDIARCTRKIDAEMGDVRGVDMRKIAEAARLMFHLSLEAYVRREKALVDRVHSIEGEVDQLFRELREQIHHHMRLDANAVVALSYLLIALHDVERVADHATNIADRVTYMITGHLPTHKS